MNETLMLEAGKSFMYFTYSVSTLILVFVFALIFLVFAMIVLRYFRSILNKEDRYNIFEIGALRKVAEKVGIDLNYEKKLIDIENGRTFRRRLEEKMIKDIFEKDEKEKKDGDQK